METYLTGRLSGVYVGGELSEIIPMRSGVPQVSVIGLLLDLLFVNDLPDALDGAIMLTYRAQNIRLH